MSVSFRSASLTAFVAMMLCAVFVSEIVAQRGRFRGGPRFGRGGRGGMDVQMLFQDSVQREIDLVEPQEEQLRELFLSMRDNMRSVFREIRELPREEQREAMMARMQEQQEQIRQKVGEILLPHQVERLEQLQLQRRLQRGDTADALASGDIREKLGLTDDQLALMRETADEAQQELREKIEQANQEAREKVLAILTPTQREKWDELMGPQFTFEDRGRRGRGRRDRGRGDRGRGGDRFDRGPDDRDE